MTDYAFSAASVPVRSEIGEAHRRVFEAIARPGAWWSGAERVAIAEEVRRARDCRLCAERRAALAPAGVEGEHACGSTLPAPAIEAIHRVATDPARLSRKWFDGILAAGLSDGQYVEILGIVVAVVSMDAFCRGLGVAPHPLPAPESGEPSGYRPASAVSAGAWVPMIPPAGAVGAEADLFRPSLAPNVIRAMSLVPDAVRALNELAAVHYLPAAQVGDPRAQRALARPQMELIAARVSAARECFY